ncbi:MAG: chlorohydrolase family protein [Alphaproteobacteria bacterium]
MAKAQPTTLIKGGWIVAFDGTEHRILTDGVVVFEGDTIRHVGKRYDGKVDETIDASKHLVIPGLINLHVHIGAHAGDRMIMDAGRRDLFRSGFLNYCPSKGINGKTIFSFENPKATIRYSLASLLKYGSTTVVEMGGDFAAGDLSAIADLAGELGLRLYTCPGFSSGAHYFDQAGHHNIHWDEKRGIADLERACAFVEKHDGSYDGRIKTILVPFEYHLCTADLLRRTKEAAKRLKVGITLHCAESMPEFQDSVRQTGRTPVHFLEDLGFLGPEVILGHCLYLSGHSQTAYPYGGDIERLVRTRANVAHCPLVFGRRGITLESFQRYRDAGVNMGIGTDSYPQDLIGELAYAAVLGKVTDRSMEASRARDIFNAVTLGGAKALGREDLGRIAPGAKADIVTLDFSELRIGPFLDPIKAMIHCGNGDLVDRVIVAGRTLVEGKRLLVWDEDKLLREVRDSTANAWGHFGEYHPLNETIGEAFPSAFRAWE